MTHRIRLITLAALAVAAALPGILHAHGYHFASFQPHHIARVGANENEFLHKAGEPTALGAGAGLERQLFRPQRNRDRLPP